MVLKLTEEQMEQLRAAAGDEPVEIVDLNGRRLGQLPPPARFLCEDPPENDVEPWPDDDALQRGIQTVFGATLRDDPW